MRKARGAVQFHRKVATVKIGLTQSMLSGNPKNKDLKFKKLERALNGEEVMAPSRTRKEMNSTTTKTGEDSMHQKSKGLFCFLVSVVDFVVGIFIFIFFKT